MGVGRPSCQERDFIRTTGEGCEWRPGRFPWTGLAFPAGAMANTAMRRKCWSSSSIARFVEKEDGQEHRAVPRSILDHDLIFDHDVERTLEWNASLG
jgi:hypothetical protein